MGTIESFEEIKVWQKARDLSLDIYRFFLKVMTMGLRIKFKESLFQ